MHIFSSIFQLRRPGVLWLVGVLVLAPTQRVYAEDLLPAGKTAAPTGFDSASTNLRQQRAQATIDAQQAVADLVEAPAASTTSPDPLVHTYDASGKLVQSVNTQTGESTQYFYQPSGALDHYVYTSGDGTFSGTYDASGKLIQSSNPKTGETTEYFYLPSGALDTYVYTSGDKNKVMTFNASGQLLKWVDHSSGGAVTYAYDSAGNFVSKTANVRDFGAKGDGVTDDAMAIQRAIAALGSDGIIELPSGTFMLGTSAGGVQFFPNGQPIQSALIISASNVTFRGQGSATLFKLMPNAKMRVLSITDASYVTLENFVIDGNKSQRNASTGWPDGDVVDGLVYTNTTASHVTVQNIEVRNGLEDAIGFWKSDYALVRNCYVHDNGAPQAGASGISLSGGAHAKAINNRSENNTIGMWTAFGSHDVTLQNNVIKNNAQEGIMVGGFTIMSGAGDNRGFLITGNELSGNGSAGFAAISIASAFDGVISNNRITANAYDGIALYDDGVNPPNSGWSIRDNYIANNRWWGIRILGRSYDITVKKNFVKNNGSKLADQMVVDDTVGINSDWRNANTLLFSRR